MSTTLLPSAEPGRRTPRRSIAATVATAVAALALVFSGTTAAHAGVYATNDITSGHIDIANIICPTGSSNRALTAQIDPNPPVYPADMHNYAFVYNDTSSAVTWVPTTGTAGYWRIAAASSTQSTAPWVGFNFDTGCGAAGEVWISHNGSNPGTVALYQGGSLALQTVSGSEYPLAAGDHEHFEWRFYAPSKPTTPATYNLNVGFDVLPGNAALVTANTLQAKFVIIP